MKQILLKTGLLLFCYTLIISNHIEKSKYVIFNGIVETAQDDRIALKEDEKFIIPYKKHIPNEKYLSFLSTYPSHLRNHVIANSSEKILPFKNKNNLYLTIFFLISVTFIVISIDFNDKSNLNKKILIISLPILFYVSENFYKSEKMPFVENHIQIEMDVSNLESKVEDVDNVVRRLYSRVNELEY